MDNLFPVFAFTISDGIDRRAEKEKLRPRRIGKYYFIPGEQKNAHRVLGRPKLGRGGPSSRPQQQKSHMPARSSARTMCVRGVKVEENGMRPRVMEATGEKRNKIEKCNPKFGAERIPLPAREHFAKYCP